MSRKRPVSSSSSSFFFSKPNARKHFSPSSPTLLTLSVNALPLVLIRLYFASSFSIALLAYAVTVFTKVTNRCCCCSCSCSCSSSSSPQKIFAFASLNASNASRFNRSNFSTLYACVSKPSLNFASFAPFTSPPSNCTFCPVCPSYICAHGNPKTPASFAKRRFISLSCMLHFTNPTCKSLYSFANRSSFGANCTHGWQLFIENTKTITEQRIPPALLLLVFFVACIKISRNSSPPLCNCFTSPSSESLVVVALLRAVKSFDKSARRSNSAQARDASSESSFFSSSFSSSSSLVSSLIVRKLMRENA
mmetsp:Transcript_2427/g.8674  ORF Transcript_2427/g.8674 Transcript_2427/m.8674 type:complete len:307 (+) Transcript_2427:1482-2402(+)